MIMSAGDVYVFMVVVQHEHGEKSPAESQYSEQHCHRRRATGTN